MTAGSQRLQVRVDRTALEAWRDQRDSRDVPGGVVGVVWQRELVRVLAWGMADLERGVPLSADSAFDIASSGKQFTACVIALLELDGVLDAEDAVRCFIPELSSSVDAVRVRHLLHHTSGLYDYTLAMHECGMLPCNVYPESDLLSLIAERDELGFVPGTAFDYSNTNYFLLGVLAERVTGKDIRVLIRERILDPLQMTHTYFSEDARRIVPNRAIGYEILPGGVCRTNMAACGGFGDAAIISTVGDLALWDRNFYDNVLGYGDGLVRKLCAPGELGGGASTGYAYGLQIGRHRGLGMVNHPGAWVGFAAEMLRVPDLEFSVICLTNRRGYDAHGQAIKVADMCLEAAWT